MLLPERRMIGNFLLALMSEGGFAGIPSGACRQNVVCCGIFAVEWTGTNFSRNLCEVMQMRSFVLEICRSRFPHVAGSVGSGLRVACGLAVLAASVVGLAAEQSPSPDVTPESFQESQRLRIEARLAAEQGDFVEAARQLQAAARMRGDLNTAEELGRSQATLQAGGGNMFAQFGPLMQLIEEQTSPPALWSTGSDEEGGTMSQYAQGVFVGAPAVIASIAAQVDNSRLLQAASLATTSNQNHDVRAASELRLVSLNRLERHVQQQLESGAEMTDDVLYLAGLTEVRFLFLFPDSGDVVIGGPAGEWSVDPSGRVLSVSSRRPTLHLDDLVTLSRTFSSSGSRFFMCSIDPKREQVKALNDYVAANRSRLSAATAAKWTESLQESLGLQNVIVQGIPGDSRVAAVILDADYRMKEIGIGRREGVSGMKSYFDLLTRSERKGGGSMDALRWWLTVGYDAIRVSPDRRSFELTGRSIRCLSENQFVRADGQRETTGKADRANAEFARLFTEHLPRLATEDVVFADLQNVFDLALVSALLHSSGTAQRTGWKASTFSASGDFAAESVEVPRELMTAAEYRSYQGGDVVIQVAGGVRADLMGVVGDAANFVPAEELVGQAVSAHPAGHSTATWWWDAAER